MRCLPWLQRLISKVRTLKEQTAERWGRPWFDHFAQDLRYAARQLWRSPGFASTVVLTLALGIGANLAIFQLLHGVLFAQLPIAQPAHLYSLRAVKSPFDAQWFFSYPGYQRLRQATQDSAPVIARSGISDGIVMSESGSSARVRCQLVSENFFDVLGISPAIGRWFLPSDEEPGQNPRPVVLRYGYWKQYFGADRSIIGQIFVVNGVSVVVVGVAPQRFSGVVAGEAPDLWLPLAAQASGRFRSWFDSLGPGSGAAIDAPYMNQSSVFWLWVLARVPDTARSSALTRWTQALEPDLALLAETAKDANDREQILQTRVQLVSAALGEGTLREDYSQPLIVLMTMAGLVLLVGCVNLANLQLARLLARQRELAVRAALGAGRWRIVRPLFVEDLLLALIGVILAFRVSRAASFLLLRWASGSGQMIPLDMHMGWQLLAFGAALLLLSLTAFSLVPGWKFVSANLADDMRSRSTQGRIARRWSPLLLAGQVSFSVLLLGMAGLFAQTLVNLNHINAGLDREHVLSIHLDFTNTRYSETGLPELYARLMTRLRELPGVIDGALQRCAIPGCVWNTAIHVSGHPEFPEKQLHGEENHVGAGYFHTMGIPILQGRDFDAHDLPTSQPVAILNRTFARKLFGDESPIGHRIGYQPPPHDADYLIVGECADARVDDLRSPAPPVAYFSVDQRPSTVGSIEVRAGGPPQALYSLIRENLLSVDPRLPITDITPLNADYAYGLSREMLLTRLTSVFGFLTLALAALGFYGLLSFSVTRRTAEIAIRISIGATPAHIRALIFRDTAWILFVGILPGVALTEIMGRVVRTLLYGSSAINLWALGFAIAVLIATGTLAGLLPAYRAATIDPVEALRAD
jgi:predicted permease